MMYRDRMTNPKFPKGNMGDWQGRHLSAVQAPRQGAERAVRDMILAWLLYADTHKERYESGIGQDGVLGVHWARMGGELRGLLNGECGRFDCGTLDGLICDTLHAEDFDPDNLP